MKRTIKLSEGKIALIPEGSSEATLLNMLIDADLLCFRREKLLYEKVLDNKYRAGKKFQNRYLNFIFENKLTVILVQDKVVPFKIRKPYDESIHPPIYIITRPEIEMLYIHHRGLYEEYKKEGNNRSGGIKPSIFLAEKYEIRTSLLKSRKWIEQNIKADELVSAIKEYDRACKKSPAEHTLCNLLK